MSDMNEPMKLYYSPGSVSLAVHLVLLELGIPFELVRTATGDEAHKRPDYLAVNPVGRIPALVTAGQTLTETPAILRFIARTTKEPSLYPTDVWQQARCDEVLSRIASLAHPNFRMVMRPDRQLGPDQEDAGAVLRKASHAAFCDALDHLERDLPDDGWAISDRMTIADPYLFVMFLWARFVGGDLDRWPNLRRIAQRVQARPTVAAAFAAEGLVDAEGRPTPPSRV